MMAATSNRALLPFCFRIWGRGDEAHHPLVTVLDGEDAMALARLLPLLGCGEEAAALAFDGLAEREPDSIMRRALRGIAQEERAHERMLLGLAAALPQTDQRVLTHAARRFHVLLGRGTALDHLARIAAVDAAVCTILSRLLRADGPIAGDAHVAALLARIRRDEARHVILSRTLVLQRANGRNFENIAAAAREALANVLMLASDALEVLAVDPARLAKDLRRLPDGLLRE